MLAKLLIVDDEPEIADLLRDVLNEEHAVDVASNGSEAMEATTRSRPDLVLLDMHMPGASGLEVLTWLRGVDPTIPVIMVTGTDDIVLIGRALEVGALSYIPKPFNASYIRHLVAAALGPSSRRRTGISRPRG